jgi:colanic acid/amylovoran biosynthesis glycosyltransferase
MKDDFAKHGYIIQRLYLRRRDELIKQTTLAIVPSEFLKQKVIEQGFSEEKIRLIHHGVDLNKFNIADAKPRWGNILYVGRLIRRKGLQFLLEALSRVKNQFPEITLTIIGDGRERTKFEEQAENLLGNRFTFLGAQPHAVVREYMARAYVFCMPSITEPTGEVETFGLVFAEAHAYGVPVVSFDSGAISEVVLNNKTGFLAEESNTDELARYLTNLLENLELRKKMGVAARERVERMFDLEKQNEELEAVYDEILRR